MILKQIRYNLYLQISFDRSLLNARVTSFILRFQLSSSSVSQPSYHQNEKSKDWYWILFDHSNHTNYLAYWKQCSKKKGSILSPSKLRWPFLGHKFSMKKLSYKNVHRLYLKQMNFENGFLLYVESRLFYLNPLKNKRTSIWSSNESSNSQVKTAGGWCSQWWASCWKGIRCPWSKTVEYSRMWRFRYCNKNSFLENSQNCFFNTSKYFISIWWKNEPQVCPT